MKFIERGVKGSVVILLHGSPGTVESMEPVMRRLSETHRVLAPWLPGYGSTPAVEGVTQPERLWEYFLRWMGSVGVDKAALVGFSRGAYHALGIALKSPELVTHLVLLAGYAGISAKEFVALGDALAAGALTLDDIERMLPERMLSDGGRRSPEAVREVKSWIHATTAEHFAAEAKATCSAPDLTPRLHHLNIPVLARVGELDQACPPAHSRAIVEALPGARLEIVPGVGHALLIEDPETPAAIDRFLREA